MMSLNDFLPFLHLMINISVFLALRIPPRSKRIPPRSKRIPPRSKRSPPPSKRISPPKGRIGLNAPLRRTPSLLDTSLASMHRRGFTASDSCLLGLSGGRSKRQLSRQMRRQNANSAILERRAMRRSMRGSLQSLDKIGREADSGSGLESNVSRYRQVSASLVINNPSAGEIRFLSFMLVVCCAFMNQS